MTRFLPAALTGLSLLAPLAAAAAEDPTVHGAAIEAWRERRAASLTRDTGWLTLAALHRLQPGTHVLGSDAAADLSLPVAAPARAGTLEVTADAVTFHAAPEVAATVGGEPVTAVPLVSDAAGEPTVVEIGSVGFFLIERGGVRLLRVRDREHPARRDFAGLDYFPVDPAWRFDAHFEAYDPPRTIPVANIIGIVEETASWGAVVFTRDGESYRIDALAEPGDEQLFLIFGDETSGKETYGAGRYLYVDAPGSDGAIDLDFNRAYNPPCAFTAFATCPLPPRQNRLPLRIEAGEKNYAAAHEP